MTPEEVARRSRILLSSQRALLGAITPNVKAVSVDWTENGIILFFFYDGEISEADREDAESVATLVVSDFDDDSIKTNCISLSASEPIPRIGRDFVFAQKGTRFES